jgi:hypothetical protein
MIKIYQSLLCKSIEQSAKVDGKKLAEAVLVTLTAQFLSHT